MVSAVIVAAGRGTRMGPNVDKLFLALKGLPVIVHTWRRFDTAQCIDEVILVVRSGMEAAFQDLGIRYDMRKPWRLVAGGKERQDSVWNGLQALGDDAEIVAIQDGARPCTSEVLIADTVRAAEKYGAAVAAQPVTDTIKESSDGQTVERTLDRTLLWAVQTPQTFQVPVIRKALETVRNQGVVLTDDTAACEYIGQPVRLVPAFSLNPKVTRPEDLPLVEILL